MATSLLDIITRRKFNYDKVGTYNDNLNWETEDFCEDVIQDGLKEGITINYNYGATQLCFFDRGNHDFVIKLPFIRKEWTNYSYDENEEEVEEECEEPYQHNYTEDCIDIYKEAINAGVAMFFAKVDQILPGLYTQEFVNARECTTSPRINNISEEAIKNVVDLKKKNNWHFDTIWIADCIYYYGKERFEKFFEFIKEMRINDLHNGNYGWTDDGYPRILDYAGYNEGTDS